MTQEIRFCKPEGEYWFLSPLAAFPIKMSVDGKEFTFPTVEHYYQAMKFYVRDPRFRFVLNQKDPDAAELLKSTGDAILIKSCPVCYKCGFGGGSGYNRIGKVLMQIRSELQR